MQTTSYKAPGIIGLMMQYPSVASKLNVLAEEILRGKNPLSQSDRELLATAVSYGNGCNFCFQSHGAVVATLDGDYRRVEAMLRVMDYKPISREEMQVVVDTLGGDKIFTLIGVASGVAIYDERNVPSIISMAKEYGKCTDEEIHTAVIIGASFSMFNRYVEALNPESSDKREDYKAIGEMLATKGYLNSIPDADINN